MIKLVGIHKIYEDGNIGFLALKDINLDFKDDHFVCILGKSGSGKTTLLNIIGGLDNPSSGHMVINGELTTKFTKTQWDYFRNYKIGFVFQNFSLIEHLTVLDNVKIAVKLQGIKEEEAKEKALEMLKRVNILDQAHKLPQTLSGGQRQRVAIARALVNSPDVILADEPTGNLDKKTSKEVLELLREISQDKLVIMVTHSKKIANTYADRIIELKDGMVISDTKPYLNERVHIYKSNIKYTKFRFVDKVKHALKNIRMKKWRSFLISLGLAIGVSSFVLIDGISNGIKVNIKENLSTQTSRPDLKFYVTKEGVDSDEFKEELLKEKYILAVRTNRGLNPLITKVNGIEVNDKYLGLSYKFTDLKDEQYRLFGEPYEDGRFPQADNEILLSYDFAYNLYKIDSMKAIWSELKNGTISIATEYYFGIPYDIYEYAKNGEYLCKAYPFIDENTEPIDYDEKLYGPYQEQIATQKDLFNKLVIDDDKIYICPDYDVFKKYLSLEVKSTTDFTVVGINNSQNISTSIITENAYMNWQIDDYYKNFSQYDVYLTEEGRENTYEIMKKYAPDVYIEEVYQPEPSFSFIDIFVGIAQFIISMILVVSVVTAGLMLLMVLLISVMERSREIGILRSLGATRSDILSVFVSESGVIGFFAGVIGIVISLFFTVIGNIIIRYYYRDILLSTFNRTNINIVILKPLSCVIAVVVCILLAMAFGLLPAIKASKKTPINALKRL